MKQTFYPFGWKQKSEVCPWDKDERMMSDHKGSNAQWIEREHFRSDRWARDPITLTFLHIEEIPHNRHSILKTIKSQIQVFASLWSPIRSGKFANNRNDAAVAICHLSQAARSQKLLQVKPHHFLQGGVSDFPPWWYTGLVQILGDTQAWCKLLQSFVTNLIFWFWPLFCP